jgi:hydroxymethylpyrimidine/phosphomethylpyrimidine kinase
MSSGIEPMNDMGEMMKAGNTMRVALTVAGSDSGGGAGIQADLKTFHALGVFGASAITCITAQNPRRVSAVLAVDPRTVGEQMERVFEAFPIRAAKTGMLYDAAIIEIVAAVFRKWKVKSLVVDPVMVSSSGAPLLKKDAVSTLRTKLFPLASVVTPNVSEAGVLSRSVIRSLDQLREAARMLAENFGVPVLVKGGHLKNRRRAVDVLFDGREFHEFSAPIVPHIKTHGTGCAFSAAITANLALGHDLPESVRRAKLFVTRAIRHAVRIGNHRALRI